MTLQPWAQSAAQARRVADRYPDREIPCPLCEATPRGVNVPDHLRKVHAGEELSGSLSSTTLQFRGRDRRIFWGLGPGILLFIAIPVILVYLGHVAFDDTLMALLAVPGLVFVLVGLSALLGLLPARLEMDHTELRLLWCFGLLTRRVPLSATIEVGPLMERPVHSDTVKEFEVTFSKSGSYLRLGDGPTITIVTERRKNLRRGGPGVRGWEGWTLGPRRRIWDITVDQRVMRAIVLHLIDRGYLSG
jgi:hypothetical protein